MPSMRDDPQGQVPNWGGDPKTWRTYRRKALQYQEGTKIEDRYLCGPRLEARLTARAEAAVERCKPGWLSRSDGVERLVAWLERRCSRQAAPDVGQELETFLRKGRAHDVDPPVPRAVVQSEHALVLLLPLRQRVSHQPVGDQRGDQLL